MSVITMESLPTEQPDPYTLLAEAAQTAAAVGVSHDEISAITCNFDLEPEQQTRRILELAEFRRGDQSGEVFDRIPIDEDAAKLAFTVYESSIDPSVAMQDGNLQKTKSEAAGRRLRDLRHTLSEKLGKIEVPQDVIDGVLLVTSEFGGNVIRRSFVEGGNIHCGFNTIGQLAIVAEGKANPEGVSYEQLGQAKDRSAESGRGLLLCMGYGQVSRYPTTYTNEGEPSAWGFTCTLETPQSQALAKLVFEGVRSPYDLGIEAPTASTITPVSLQRPIL